MATIVASKPRTLLRLPPIVLPLAFLIASAAIVVAMVLLSVWFDGGWNQAATAAGVVATVVAAAVLLGTGQGWANGARLSFAAAATGVVGLAALSLAIVTYVGGGSNAGLGASASAAPQQTTNEGAALAQAVSNNTIEPPGYSHDLGAHPTFSQFMSMSDAQLLASVPGGTLLPTEVPVLKEQIQQARDFALSHDTIEKAMAAGYYNTTNDVPFMGAHFINSQYLSDGVFDASKPEGLLFSKIGNPSGDWKLVGVWYLILPGQGGSTATIPPQGFAGNLDLWHIHYGLCTRAGIISENNTYQSCQADQGNWIGDLRWMMHVWVYPESGVDNSNGVFAYLNQDLWAKQQGAPGVQAGQGLGQANPNQ
jgi:hypothetical protein